MCALLYPKMLAFNVIMIINFFVHFNADLQVRKGTVKCNMNDSDCSASGATEKMWDFRISRALQHWNKLNTQNTLEVLKSYIS